MIEDSRAEELYSKLERLTSNWDKKQTKFLESAITQKLVNELKSNSIALLALLLFGLIVAALALYLNTIYLSEESIRALNESSSSIGSVLFIASKLASTSILFLFLYFIIGQVRIRTHIKHQTTVMVVQREMMTMVPSGTIDALADVFLPVLTKNPLDYERQDGDIDVAQTLAILANASKPK